MPKLPDIKYREVGKTGDVVDFTASVLVTSDGVFHITIPEYLKDTAITLSFSTEFSRCKWKIYGDSLSRCEAMVLKTIKEYLACTTEKSLVILYEFISTCHFAKNSADEIFPNGSFCPDDYRWTEERNAEHNEKYLLGFKARIFVKLLHRRSASEKVEYEPIHFHSDECEKLGNWGQLLNEFVKVGHSRTAQELPYTEEMAKVFYEAMMGLCTLSDKLSQVFSDPKNLLSLPGLKMLGAGDKEG